MIALAPVVVYPPRGRLLVPTSDRGSAGAGLALHMACRPTVVAAHHAAMLLTAIVGPRAIPGRSMVLDDGDLAEVAPALRHDWQTRVAPFDAVAVLRRRQTLRPALLCLLIRNGRARAFVKAVPTEVAAPLITEGAVLEALAAHRASSAVCAARPIANGTTAGWSWLAVTPFAPRPHRPAPPGLQIQPILAWYRRAASAAIGRGSVPSHWLPMHGDFAPWNLRRYFRGDLVLCDFEDARYGPPAADLTYWQATNAVLHRRRAPLSLDPEAVSFWLGVVEDRLGRGLDPALDQRLAEVFRAAA